MIRLAIVGAAILGLLPQTSLAAQVTSSMGVGLIIEDVARSGESQSARRLSVSGVVSKAVAPASYTWNAAAISVKRAGFKQPRRVEKLPGLYWFEAKRRGTSFRIAVSILSGRVVKIIGA